MGINRFVLASGKTPQTHILPQLACRPARLVLFAGSCQLPNFRCLEPCYRPLLQHATPPISIACTKPDDNLLVKKKKDKKGDPVTYNQGQK